MAQFYVFFNPEAKEIHALLNDSAPANSTKVGEFTHNGDDPLGYVDNHVIYQHIRDIFYKVDLEGNPSFFPDNITDFAPYKITVDVLVLPMRIDVTSDDVSVAEGATVDLEVTVVPDGAFNKDVTYSSSDEAIATVSDTGTVTGVAEGETEITITSDAVGTVQKTVSVTVTV